jgi:hypothetical protein
MQMVNIVTLLFVLQIVNAYQELVPKESVLIVITQMDLTVMDRLAHQTPNVLQHLV